MILHDFYMKNDVFSNQIALVGYTVILGERISLHCVKVKILFLKPFFLSVNRNMIPWSSFVHPAQHSWCLSKDKKSQAPPSLFLLIFTCK